MYLRLSYVIHADNLVQMCYIHLLKQTPQKLYSSGKKGNILMDRLILADSMCFSNQTSAI